MERTTADSGEIVLSVGSPFPRTAEGPDDVEATEDAALVGQGYAALTALRGPRADEDPELFGLLDAGLVASLAPLGLKS
jgi:hypothetical protein